MSFRIRVAARYKPSLAWRGRVALQTPRPMDAAAIAEIAALRALLPQVPVVDRRWAGPRLDQVAVRVERGQPAERMFGELRTRLEAGFATVARRSALPLVIAYPENLPVAQRRDDILATLRDHRALVLTGETGSGKTTQLPKLLLESGYGRKGMIALTQPRRVAAVSMAARIRSELQAGEGVVAHSVRFDDRATPDTLVRVMTDGLLLAEATNDPDFSRYDAIVIDEAHERGLNIDLLLGLLTLVRTRRPDLMIVVSSASIAAERFAEYLAGPVIAVAGRTFPVDIRYRPPADDDIGYLGAALNAVRELHRDEGPGDVLCFLPTERDILEARRRLDDLAGAVVVPLFGRLTPQEQARAFATCRGRKVILATNVAETSLTIPGIRYVVDTGLARFKRYHAGSRTERLPVEPVAQASCLQRAGRAGRIEAGVCIRLYREEDFAARELFTVPEILRSNLAGVLLQCLSLGLGQPEDFPWLDAPSPHAWQLALVLVDELGAFAPAVVGQAPGLSPLGRQISAIPADPQVARILIAGVHEGVPHEACTIAAFLSVQDPRVRPVGQEAKADAAHRAFVHEAGDLMSVLLLWETWQGAASNSAKARLAEKSFLGYRRMREWADVRHQLWQALRDGGRGGKGLPPSGHAIEVMPIDRIHRAVLAGMLGNVLMYDPEERCYRAAGDRRLHVHPGSALKAGKADDGKRAPAPPPWLVACEVVETSRLFARLCAPIDPQWVIDLAGDRVKRRHRDPHWHPKRRQVVCLETVTWKGLPVREGRLVPYERVDPRDASAVFVKQALLGDDLDREFPIVATNRHMVVTARGLRDRLRDGLLWVDDGVAESCYRERLALDRDDAPVIASSDALRRWLALRGPDALRIALADLVDPALAERAERDAPQRVRIGRGDAALTYRFAPGDEAEGATLDLDEARLGEVDLVALDWLIPGWLLEMVEALLGQLPKDLRRRLIPLADSARELLAELNPVAGRRPLPDALADALRQRLGQPCPPFDRAALPPHLRLRFRIHAADGSVSYCGREPAVLARQAAGAGDRLRMLKAEWETAPAAAWPGDCPGRVTVAGITGVIGLARARDERGGVAARRAVYAGDEAAAAWHDDGLDALIEATLDSEFTTIAQAPASPAIVSRVERVLGGRFGGLRRALALAAATAGERARVSTEDEWTRQLDRARADLLGAKTQIDGALDRIATRAEALRSRLRQGAKSLAVASAMRAAARHLELLLAPGWITTLAWPAHQRVDAYIDGISRRLDAAHTRLQDGQRLADRCETLLTLWSDATGDDDRRLAQCLGFARTLRGLATVREECLLGFAAGSSTGAGFVEGKLRGGLADIGKRIAAERAIIARTREVATDLHRALARLPPGPRRNVLTTDGGKLLAMWPDCSLGADLLAQRQALEAWCERVRLAQMATG